MSIGDFRPLKYVQDYYRSFYAGSVWEDQTRTLPKVGYMCYITVHTPKDSAIMSTTQNQTRGYLSTEGWRTYDGNLLQSDQYVGFWKYDETSQGSCDIV